MNFALTFVITFVGVIVPNVLTFVNTFFKKFCCDFFTLDAIADYQLNCCLIWMCLFLLQRKREWKDIDRNNFRMASYPYSAVAFHRFRFVLQEILRLFGRIFSGIICGICIDICHSICHNSSKRAVSAILCGWSVAEHKAFCFQHQLLFQCLPYRENLSSMHLNHTE